MKEHTYSVGDIVEIVDNTGCHGFKIGDIVRIEELIFEKEEEDYYRAIGLDGRDWFVGDEEIKLLPKGGV